MFELVAADWAAAKAVLASPLASYAGINRPTLDEAEQIVTWLAGRPGAAVSEIAALFPGWRQPAIQRGLLWIARFGVIELKPPA